MGTKAERRAASERGAAYHEARLGELIEYITAAIDRYRAGEIDAYTVDATIHHYHRAARELWIFCWSRSEGTVCGPRGGVAGAGPWATRTGVCAGRHLRSHGRAAAWWRCWAR